MTGKCEEPSFNDLEPMLYDIKHSIRLLIVMLEAALDARDSNIDEDDSEAIYHAAYNVRRHADRALWRWIEAHGAAHRKTAA